MLKINTSNCSNTIVPKLLYMEFLATDPEARVRFQALSEKK
jgi:hypothetical protein